MSRFRGKTKLSPGTGKKSLSPGPKLFGSSIDDKREGIPRVVMIAQAYFETYGVATEGLFRISAEKPVLDALVAKFDDGSPVDISSYADSGHTMAGLLKRYFRDMPEPLIPFDLYEAFTRAVGDGEMEQRALRLQKIVALLSKPRLATLQALMEILVLVAASQHLNKMGAENLAVVFAPTLFRPPGDDMGRSMTDMPQTACCVVLMINFFERVFPRDEKDAKKKKNVSAPEVVLLPGELDTPPLPPLLPPLPYDGKSGKRGSVTLDNAQLGSLLAKKSNGDAEGLVALVGKVVWAQYALDGKWYRASVESVTNEGMATVVFTDYGNRQYCRADQVTLTDPSGVIAAPPTTPISPVLPTRVARPTVQQPVPPVAAPVTPQARPEPVQRPEVQPRSPAQRSATVMAKLVPSIAIAPHPPSRPQVAPRQSDSQLSPRLQQQPPQPESPRSESPRGLTRSVTAAPSVAPRPEMRRGTETSVAALPTGSPASVGSLGSMGQIAMRPAPMPRAHVASSGHASPVVSLPTSGTGSPALSRVSPPVPPARVSQPLARVSPTTEVPVLPPLALPIIGAAPEDAPPVLPELPVAVLDVSPRIVAEAVPHAQPPRMVPLLALPAEIAEAVEPEEQREEQQELDDVPAPLPELPPKTESVLSKMKEVASLTNLPSLMSPVVVKVDANALLSSAPPPSYVEFDDE